MTMFGEVLYKQLELQMLAGMGINDTQISNESITKMKENNPNIHMYI